MSATSEPIYAVIEVTIQDEQQFMRYVAGHMETIFQYGGSFVGEYQAIRPIEDPSVQLPSAWTLVVIQEWPSETHFLRWWHSPEYAPWKPVRAAAAQVSLTLASKIPD